jgi:hypothetical protein
MALRAVKNRKADTSHENDLRGLGNEKVFTNSQHKAMLHVTFPKDVELTKTIKVVSEKLGASSTVDKTHWFCLTMAHANYKVQALRLFFAATEVLKQHPKATCHLSVSQELKKEMRAHFAGKQKEESKRPTKEGHLFMDKISHQAIVQAEISFESRPEGDLLATSAEEIYNAINKIKKQNKSHSEETHKVKKHG